MPKDAGNNRHWSVVLQQIGCKRMAQCMWTMPSVANADFCPPEILIRNVVKLRITIALMRIRANKHVSVA